MSENFLERSQARIDSLTIEASKERFRAITNFIIAAGCTGIGGVGATVAVQGKLIGIPILLAGIGGAVAEVKNGVDEMDSTTEICEEAAALQEKLANYPSHSPQQK